MSALVDRNFFFPSFVGGSTPHLNSVHLAKPEKAVRTLVHPAESSFGRLPFSGKILGVL